jgi:hypothetical protein
VILAAGASESTLQQAAYVGQVVAGVTSVLIIFSAWLLWLQVRQQARDSRTELITGMTGFISTAGRAFIDYPEMRKYFYDRVVPQGADRERACAIAISIAGTMDHVAAHFDIMGRREQLAWKAYFTDSFNNSPVLREHLETHKSWYGPKFRAYFEVD